jgi:hypothetical protein
MMTPEQFSTLHTQLSAMWAISLITLGVALLVLIVLIGGGRK